MKLITLYFWILSINKPTYKVFKFKVVRRYRIDKINKCNDYLKVLPHRPRYTDMFLKVIDDINCNCKQLKY